VDKIVLSMEANQSKNFAVTPQKKQEMSPTPPFFSEKRFASASARSSMPWISARSRFNHIANVPTTKAYRIVMVSNLSSFEINSDLEFKAGCWLRGLGLAVVRLESSRLNWSSPSFPIPQVHHNKVDKSTVVTTRSPSSSFN